MRTPLRTPSTFWEFLATFSDRTGTKKHDACDALASSVIKGLTAATIASVHGDIPPPVMDGISIQAPKMLQHSFVVRAVEVSVNALQTKCIPLRQRGMGTFGRPH